MMMKSPWSLSIVIFAGALGAGENLAPPKTVPHLQTALARAEKSGKQVVLFLKVVNLKTMVVQKDITVYREVEKLVGDKKVLEKVPVVEKATYAVHVAEGFRDIKVAGKDVKVTDLAGKSVLAGKLPALLSKFTPVLLNTNQSGPVEPFWLLNVKEGTLIVGLDEALLRGESAPGKSEFKGKR